jgi:hypothetical protein
MIIRAIHLVIQLVIDAFVIGLCLYISDRLTKGHDEKKKRKEQRAKRGALALRSVLAAGLVLGSNSLVQLVDSYLNRPVFEIHTSNANDAILLTIKVVSGVVDQITIRYPILGVINNLSDMNAAGGARTVVARAVGAATENATLNTLELVITDIRPGVNLSYRAFYTPTSEPVFMAGTDGYMVTYLWEYAGQKTLETEWRSIKDDKIRKEPNIQTYEGEIFHRALSPEEIRQRFREGIPKRPLQ